MNIQAALVRSILEQWSAYQWTVQGFGFLRTKIADVGRIHVWDRRLAVPLASEVHTHPWPLQSLIISGELTNHSYQELQLQEGQANTYGQLPYRRAELQTGEGGGLVDEPVDVWLGPCRPLLLTPGEEYTQAPAVIHRTSAVDGTVTLIQRPQGPPDERAFTYWPRGTNWVSAEPRPANKSETAETIAYALDVWCTRS